MYLGIVKYEVVNRSSQKYTNALNMANLRRVDNDSKGKLIFLDK